MAELKTDVEKNAAAFARRLGAWFDRFARPMPWRQNPSLYGTVVSEFMLQQTQVAAVVPYFERWMKAFPDFARLARADEAQVLKLWEGLGYYARAKNLLKLAKRYVDLPEALRPKDPQAWREMPGVGPYASAAIASIAQNFPVAVCDGNVVRILTRLHADGTLYPSSSGAAKLLQEAAQALLDKRNPSRHNQAMMDLGATVCTPKNPGCPLCPVSAFCLARARGQSEAYPRLAKRKIEKVELPRAWWADERGRLLLLQKHAQSRRLADFYEIPPLAELRRAFPQARLCKKPFAARKRGISNQQIREVFYRVERPAAPPASLPEKWVFADARSREKLPLSGPHRKWINALFKEAEKDARG